MITKFDDIITLKYGEGQPRRKLAVVSAASDHVIGAVMKAYEDGLVEPVLIGDELMIKEILREMNCSHPFEIRDAKSPEACIKVMLDLVHDGQVDAVMKGLIETRDLMSAVVKDPDFRTDGIITSMCLYKIDNYPKVLGILDAGIVMYPTLEQKAAIVKTAVDYFHKMGYERPKVGIMCSVDLVNPKMPETVDAQKLTEMGAAGEFGDCEVYGPLSYDLCVDKESAQIKGCESPVAGDADIIVVPDINSGNVLVKCLYIHANVDAASLLLGTKVPVVITSRMAKAEEKYWSIVISCALQ